jgi:hypothetical protein
MTIKGISVEFTFEELRAIATLLGSLNDHEYLNYAKSQQNVIDLKNIYSSIINIVDSLNRED